MEIIPAIIPKSYEDLSEKIAQVKNLVSCIQVDVTDGVFVSSKSWPFTDSFWSSGVFLDIPFRNEFKLEFDLMVQNPEDNIKDWIGEGAGRVIVHAESSNKLDEVVNKIKENNIEVGLAFNIDTSIFQYKDFLEKVDFVQLMGIEKIGYQGQSFSEKVYDKIKELREIKSDVVIVVDGGVNLDNAKILKGIGVERVAVGSALFDSDDIEETIKNFKKI